MSLLTTYNDKQLLDLLQKDDEKAFQEIYDRYWKKLLIKAHLLLNSAEDAEELVHDVFVTIWRKRATIVIQNSFYTYICAILQYDAFKLLAERKHKRIISSAAVPEAADQSTQEWLDFEYLRAEMEAAIKELPDKCQLVFRLSREQGLSDKEIADKMGISINTVKTQKLRALQRLKTSLQGFFLF